MSPRRVEACTRSNSSPPWLRRAVRRGRGRGRAGGGAPGVRHDLQLGAVADQRVKEELGAGRALGHDAAGDGDDGALVVRARLQRLEGFDEGGQAVAHLKLVREGVVARRLRRVDVLHPVLEKFLRRVSTW